MNIFSRARLEDLKKWAKTLDDAKKKDVLDLIDEVRAYYKLQGALHDELINDMS